MKLILMIEVIALAMIILTAIINVNYSPVSMDALLVVVCHGDLNMKQRKRIKITAKTLFAQP